MLTNETKAWAKNFFYTSLGLQAPNQLLISDEVVESTYKHEFVKPVSLLIYGEEREELSPKDVASFMSFLRGTKIVGVLHLVSYLVGKNYLTQPIDFSAGIKDAEEEFLQDHTMCYGVCVGSKVFKCYTDMRQLLCGYYEKPVAILGQVSKFPRGLNLKVLMSQQPTRLNDPSIEALKVAVENSIVSESDLSRQKYLVPVNGKFEEKYVTAISPELPPYFVRTLISELPEATIEEVGNPYIAALEYAEAHPSQCRIALAQLNEIFSKIEQESESSTQSDVELNDEVVMKYLHDKYGLPEGDLQERLFVPTTDKLYTSSYLLSEEAQNMSAEEFVEYAAQNPLTTSGTLDEILEAFCRVENFDTEKSVRNLIRFINDEPLVEKNIHEQVEDFVKEHDMPQDISLYEFITGEEVPGGRAAAALNVLFEEAAIDEGFFKVIGHSIKEKVKAVMPSLSDMLAKIRMPDSLRDSINRAAVTNDIVVVEKPETTADDVVDYLTKHGIPRAIASDVTSGLYTEIRDTVGNGAVNYLISCGIPEGVADAILNGSYIELFGDTNGDLYNYLVSHNIPEDTAKALSEGNYTHDQKPSQSLADDADDAAKYLQNTYNQKTPNMTRDLDDGAYKAAEYLLYTIRSGITSSDSLELRATYLPIIYSFVRVLMMSKGDEQDVIEFLERNGADASPEIIECLHKASEMLVVK